jgi:predicted transcriptional regulator with HTH domain
MVVSEETGQTSLAINGAIIHNLSRTELRTKIRNYLLDIKEEELREEITES